MAIYFQFFLQDNLPVRDLTVNSAENLPVKVVGNFLRSVFANLSPNILYPISLSQPTPIPALPMNSKFTLHSVHSLNPFQMLLLIFAVFDGVPNSFQIFQCTPNTIKQHLDIFFDRVFHWSHHQYLLLGVNYLHNELQEVYLCAHFTNNVFLILSLNNRCLFRNVVIGRWKLLHVFTLWSILSLF